jgi:hypothetical protein
VAGDGTSDVVVVVVVVVVTPHGRSRIVVTSSTLAPMSANGSLFPPGEHAGCTSDFRAVLSLEKRKRNTPRSARARAPATTTTTTATTDELAEDALNDAVVGAGDTESDEGCGVVSTGKVVGAEDGEEVRTEVATTPTAVTDVMDEAREVINATVLKSVATALASELASAAPTLDKDTVTSNPTLHVYDEASNDRWRLLEAVDTTSKFRIARAFIPIAFATTLLIWASSSSLASLVATMAKDTTTVAVSAVVGSIVGGLDDGSGVGRRVGFAVGLADGSVLGRPVVSNVNFIEVVFAPSTNVDRRSHLHVTASDK